MNFIHFSVLISFMRKNEIMYEAVKEALKTSSQGIGGPFGAAIVKDDKIICVSFSLIVRTLS